MSQCQELKPYSMVNNPRISQPNTEWTLADLIDFELLLDADKNADSKEVAQRNVKIRHELSQKVPAEQLKELEKDTVPNRRWWLHQWQQRRQALESDQDESIGTIIISTLATVGAILSVLGAALGLSSLFGLMAAPKVIHVPLTLLIYLGPQLILLALLLWALLRQKFGWASPAPPLTLNLLSRLVERLFLWLGPRVQKQMHSSDKWNRYEAGVSLIIGRTKLRSEALEWPLIQLAQRAGVSFAAAIAVGMFVIGKVDHFNFGWSSTSPWVDGKRVHKIVQVISFPWSWLLPEGVGYPSLEEIEKSQTFRDQHTLPKEFPRLSSWWIFLCLTLFTWACLPRMILLWYSQHRGRRSLAMEAFSDRRSDALFRSLAKPRLERTVSPLRPDPVSGQEPIASGPNETGHRTVIPAAHCEVFTEQELSPAQQEQVTLRINHQLNLQVSSFQNIYRSGDRKKCLVRLSELEWADGTTRVLFLYPADDPVVASLKAFVDQCLDQIGSQGHLLFGLIGRIDDLDEAVQPDDAAAWIEYANLLKRKNPNVEVEILSGTLP